jgi:conjugative relaxase-like TrwC/TraI family protein
MLGVHRLSAQGADYYLSDLAQELPPTAALHPEWVGMASGHLDLHGAVAADQLRAVLEGHHPRTGRQLGTGRARVQGFDLTFSAPKSVSVLMALGGADVAAEVLEAHGQAVKGALTYLESHALCARRRTPDGREVIPTTGALAASFTHGVSRTLDPHLHTHVVVANLVHGADGRWSALDQRGLSAHRQATSAVYDAHLRADLSGRLGVRWDHLPSMRHEVHGVSPTLLGEFSSRSADIRRQMHGWGAHSQRANRLAWASTRPHKSAGVSYDELSADWARRGSSADPAGLDLAGAFGPSRGNEPLDEHRFGAVLSLTPDGAARRRDVVTAFSAAAVSGASADTVGKLSDLWVPATATTEVGVAERAGPLRPLVPGGHLLRALGPRPVDPAAHAVWRDAAHALENYRQHWGVTRSPDAFGLDALPSGLASVPTGRLVDHLRTAQHVETARQRLGWREPPAREMDRGR